MQHFGPPDLAEPLGDGLMAYHKYSVPEGPAVLAWGHARRLSGRDGRQTLAVLARRYAHRVLGPLKKHWSLRWSI